MKSSRPSIECQVAQLAQTLRNVSNEYTVPTETLVVNSNLAVTHCIEMEQNVCIGSIGYTGIEPYRALRTRASPAWDRRSSSRSARGPVGPVESAALLSRHRDRLDRAIVEGPTGATGSFAPQNVNNVLIGNNIASLGQNIRNIAIGDEAAASFGATGSIGQNDYNIALGYRAAYAGQDHANIAIGNDSASSGGQIYENIAIGDQAAEAGQAYYNVAIGDDVVEGGQYESNVAIGDHSAIAGQNINNVAIGGPAAFFQDEANVAIGTYVGFEQVYRNIAIGTDAVSDGQQLASNIAIGDGAAYGGQDVSAIAIGTDAAYGSPTGSQGNYSIAVGHEAGADVDAVPPYSIQVGYQSNVYSNYEPEGLLNTGVAIGTNASSTDGALVLNTDIGGLSADGPGLFIQPIRPITFQTSNMYLLQYNNSTKEIIYGPQMISGVYDGSGTGSATINFGVTFASTPVVTATILDPGNTASGAMYSVSVGSVTKTSFTYYARYLVNGSGIAVAGESISWIAIGPIATD